MLEQTHKRGGLPAAGRWSLAPGGPLAGGAVARGASWGPSRRAGSPLPPPPWPPRWPRVRLGREPAPAGAAPSVGGWGGGAPACKAASHSSAPAVWGASGRPRHSISLAVPTDRPQAAAATGVGMIACGWGFRGKGLVWVGRTPCNAVNDRGAAGRARVPASATTPVPGCGRAGLRWAGEPRRGSRSSCSPTWAPARPPHGGQGSTAGADLRPLVSTEARRCHPVATQCHSPPGSVTRAPLPAHWEMSQLGTEGWFLGAPAGPALGSASPRPSGLTTDGAWPTGSLTSRSCRGPSWLPGRPGWELAAGRPRCGS